MEPWAAREGLSEEEQRWCEGPVQQPMTQLCDRATIAGITFACKRIQALQKAKSTTVMLGREDEPAFGQVKAFMRWMPPWGQSNDDCLEIADVRWYASRGFSEELGMSPQVSRQSNSDRGNGLHLCMVQEIFPMPVCLVPHLRRSDLWQVLSLASYDHELA